MRLMMVATLAFFVSSSSRTSLAIADDTKQEGTKITFAQVKPIITKRCGKCHSGDRPRGELELTSLAGIMQGGVSGKAVVAGKPEESLLYTTTTHLEDPKMPPNSPKIPQTEIDTIRKWIEGGLIEKSGNAATSIPAPQPRFPDGITKADVLARATPIAALAASPTASFIAVPGKKQVLIYQLDGKLLGGVSFPEGEIQVLRFSRDGKILLAAGGIGGQSGAVVGFEVGTWKRLFRVTDDTDAILAADISTDKTRIVYGGPSRLVKLATIPDGKIAHTFRKPTDWVMSVGFSPEGLLVAAGDRFGGLFVWETKSGKEFYSLRGHTKAVTAIAWQTDSNSFISSSDDGIVRLWDMHSGTESAKWEAHSQGVLDVAFHSSGTIATAGRDAHVRVWDAHGKLIKDLGVANDTVMRLGFTANGKTIITGDWAGEVRLWLAAGGVATKLALPIDTKPLAVTAIPVPVPELPVATQTAPGITVRTAIETLKTDLTRKRLALKAVEDAAEKLKEEAARSPKNAALAKAYLQLCEVVLAMKADVLETEAAITGHNRGEKK